MGWREGGKRERGREGERDKFLLRETERKEKRRVFIAADGRRRLHRNPHTRENLANITEKFEKFHYHGGRCSPPGQCNPYVRNPPQLDPID